MQNSSQPCKLNHPFEIYRDHLTSINGIQLTLREIDVISCLLNGRNIKGIANFLSISPKTAATHLYNATKRFGVNSNGMITLLENSDKFVFLKKYYLALITNNMFSKALNEVGGLVAAQGVSFKCMIVYWYKKPHYLEFIINDLKSTGCEVVVERRDDLLLYRELLQEVYLNSYLIYFLPDDFDQHPEQESHTTRAIQDPEKKIFFVSDLPQNSYISNETPQVLCVCSTQWSSYYLSFFQILMKMLPSLELNEIIKGFEDKANTLQQSPLSVATTPYVESQLHDKPTIITFVKQAAKKIKRDSFLFGLTSLTALVFIAIWAGILNVSMNGIYFNVPAGTSQFSEHQGASAVIRSDFATPVDTKYLNRQMLADKIDETLKGKDNIRVIALVGIGGVGKTTLARHYANSHNDSIVWELNSETYDNIVGSFKDLMYALASSKKSKDEIDFIENIKDVKEREKQILNFVRRHLRNNRNWLLIFDNVDTISEIKQFLPNDMKIWGDGKVIITTRNNNIDNNSFIKIDHVIPIGELGKEEALTLFCKLFYNEEPKNLSLQITKEASSFLQNIPAFPLDICISCYYIKKLNMTFEEYLRDVDSISKDFDSNKSNLKEFIDYDKTRYGIVSLSFRKIIEIDPNYRELLYFLTLINSEKIYKEILDFFNLPFSSNKFLNDLSNYGIISSEDRIEYKISKSYYSIHRTTQQLGLKYLNSIIEERDKEILLKNIVDYLYLYYKSCDRNNFDVVYPLFFHLKRIHENLPKITADERHVNPKLLLMLGEIYLLYMSNFPLASEYLEKASKQDKSNLNNNDYAILCKDLGELNVALNCLDKAIAYASESLKLSSSKKLTVQNIQTFGSAYILKNDFYKAREYIEKGLLMISNDDEKELPFLKSKSELYLLMALLYSKVYCNTNLSYDAINYAKKGIDLVKGKLILSSNKLDTKSQEIALTVTKHLTRLGDLYCRINQYDKAQNEGYVPALKLFNSFLPKYKNVLVEARIMAGQADVYANSNNFNKAYEHLTKALKVFDASFPPSSELLRIAHLKRALVCLKIGDEKGFVEDINFCMRYNNMYQTNEFRFLYAECLKHLAILKYTKNDLEGCLEAFSQVLNVIEDINASYQILNISDKDTVYKNIRSFYKEFSKNKQNSDYSRLIDILSKYLLKGPFNITGS